MSAARPAVNPRRAFAALSQEQRDVFRLIRWSLSVRGTAPTLRRIARALAADPEDARDHLAAVESMGLVRREGKTRRRIRLSQAGKAVL